MSAETRSDIWRMLGITLGISAAGGLAGAALGLPAGLLIGGATCVALASLLGIRTGVTVPVRNTGFVIVGMTLGTNVHKDSLTLIQQWPLSLIGLVVAIAVMIAVSTFVLTRVFGEQRATAVMSSIPGHLSFVLALTEAGRGDTSRIAVIQSIRVLLLTILVPIVARFVGHFELIPGASQVPMEWLPLLVLALAATAGGYLLNRLNMPAGFVLGSMFVSIVGKLMGLYDGVLPSWLTAIGFVLMGGLIGSRFSGVSRAAFANAAMSGVVVTIVSVVTVSAVAALLAPLTGLPFGQLWIGLSPGALETMGALGLALGFDTAFIAAHHTARFMLISLAAPLLARFVHGPRVDQAT